MSKTISNSELVETIKEQGFITEKQLMLLKKRLNNNSRESANELYMMVANIMPIKLTAEQEAKGREWLLNKNLKKNGEFRKQATLTETEISVLNTLKDAYLSDFYELGNGYITNNVPIYRYANSDDYFEYYVQGGDAQLY